MDWLADEGDVVLAAWLSSMGRGADEFPELRRLIERSHAGVARAKHSYASAIEASLVVERSLRGSAMEVASQSSLFLEASIGTPIGAAE